jgi:CRP/FNR family transcriptional regulator, cyclic AMP receptor protein
MIKMTAATLANQRFLNGLRADQLDALAETASEVMFPAGHRIFADGGYVGSFWLIESGCVTLDVQVPGRCPMVIGTVGMGSILGWSWLIPEYEWAFGAVCTTEVRAIQFSAEAVRRHCADDPDLGVELIRRFLPVLAGRLQSTRARLIATSLT